jgi:hypothetical protein
MWVINSILNKIFEIIFLPFRGMSPWVGMIIVSLLTGFLMLFIYRHTSNQAGIRSVKDKIKAHLLEIRLFKDNMGVSLKAQGNILLANFRYIAYAFRPLLVMIIPIILILVQLNFWFAYRALEPGETAILKITLAKGQNPLQTEMEIEPSPAFEIETPALRIDEDNSTSWRLRAKEKGVHSIHVRLANQTLVKTITVGQRPLTKISPLKVSRNFLDQVFYPVEKPLPGDAPVKSIEISFPERGMNLFGWHIHWLIVYFALSIILGFAFKGVFKVEI